MDGNIWRVNSGGSTVWTGNNILQAMREALGSLTPNRNSKERVVVRGSGSIPANESLDLPSDTTLDVCGTINVSGSPGEDNAALRGRNVRNVEIQNVNITGTPYFGIFFRKSHDIILGNIDLRLSGGLGIRIDNDPSGSGNYGNTDRSTNIRIKHVYVSGTNNHGVENITNVKEVITRGGGRGIFCVSESGGVIIDKLDILNAGQNNSILVENCYDVVLAAESGKVEGSLEVRLAGRSEFDNNRNITVQNLTVVDAPVRERPCGENVVFRNNRLSGGASYDICTEPVSVNQEDVTIPGPISNYKFFFNEGYFEFSFQFENDGYAGSQPALIQLKSLTGKTYFAEKAPNFGLYSKKVSLKARGVFLLVVQVGKKSFTRFVLAQ